MRGAGSIEELNMMRERESEMDAKMKVWCGKRINSAQTCNQQLRRRRRKMYGYTYQIRIL